MCKNPINPAGNEVDAAVEPKSSQTKLITNAELRQHNVPGNAWAAVHGKVLDITDFAKRHPGGDLILLAAGKDASVLFETYHPRGVPESLVNKLTVGVMKDGEIQDSFYSWDSEFYKVLRKRVVARIEERGLTRRGSYEIQIKALLLLAGFWGGLYKMVVADSFSTAAAWSMFLGVFAAFVGTCIQHDGNHGAFSQMLWLNKVAGWTLDMIGASAFTWEFQHMLGHHPYTNVLDIDEDDKKEKGLDCPIEEKDQESDPDVFSSFPFMRMHPHHQASWYHKYQHLYAPVLFSLMTIAKVFQQDIEVASQKRLYHIDAQCRYGSMLNVIRFWGMKALSVGYMIVLPSYFHGVAKGVGLFFIAHLTCGEMLATMFIVNHVIEGVAFGSKSNENGYEARPVTVSGQTPMKTSQAEALKKNKDIAKIPLNDWAAVQCQTSVNWAPGSWFWNHFSGGLSHQIEHHLFPSICHTNYYHIHDVVEKTCEEYGIPYQSEPSLWSAYKKMLAHLRYLGNEKQLA